MMEPRRLYRNTHDAMVAGVCSGLGEYLGIDKTVLRVAFALLVVFTLLFPGVVVYVVMWLIVPPRPAGPYPAPYAAPPPPQP